MGLSSYRKTSESRSNWTKSGHGHGGSNQRDVILPSCFGSRETLSLVHLLSSSRTADDGRWVSTGFSFKRNEQRLATLVSRQGSERRRESRSLSVYKNRDGQCKDDPEVNRDLG